MITSLLSWINGISAFILWFSAWGFAIAGMVYYHKTHNHPFVTCICLGIAVGLGWTGIFSSFISNLFTGDNQWWTYYFPRYLTFGVIPLGAISIIDTMWNIAGNPKNRKQILIGFFVYTLFYYIVYYGWVITTYNSPDLVVQNSIVVVQNASPTDTLFDDWVNPTNLFYYVLWAEILFAAIVSGVGFTKFIKVSSGALKNKAIYLLFSTLFIGGGILEDLVDFSSIHLYYLWILRLLVVPGVWLMFFGFKPLGAIPRQKRSEKNLSKY